MSQTYSHALPARHALDGVRKRRLTALGFDFVVVSMIAFTIWAVLVILTLGLALFFLPPLWPIVAFFYSGVSMSGPRHATPGMRMMDLEVVTSDTGEGVPFLNAAAHGAFFYISWFFPAVFLVTLVDGDKRFLHDIFSGVLVRRRA